jgi:hypothetical protein
MGVSVRVSRNVRFYVPFWIAIPVWLAVAAGYVVVFTLYGVIWLLMQGGAGVVWLIAQGFHLSASGIGGMHERRQVRRAVPIIRRAPDIATARAASAASVGGWCGPVQNVKRGWGRVQFEVIDPDRSPAGPFVFRQKWQGMGLSIPWGIGYPDLARLRAGDVVELMADASGRDPQVSIVQRADGTIPESAIAVAPAEEAAVPQEAALPEPTPDPPLAPVDVQHPALPRARVWVPPMPQPSGAKAPKVQGPGRRWFRDWAMWVLILALPTIIAGAAVYSPDPARKVLGSVLIDVPIVLGLPAALITLIIRWLRKWRGSRTRHAA